MSCPHTTAFCPEPEEKKTFPPQEFAFLKKMIFDLAWLSREGDVDDEVLPQGHVEAARVVVRAGIF